MIFLARPRSLRRRIAMTLLEVLIAVAILGIVAVMIFTVFRGAVESYSRAGSEGELIERARYVFDAIESDVANVHYRDETTYNVYMSAILKEFELARLKAQETNNWQEFEARYGARDPSAKSKSGADDPTYVGNPYEKGRLINLSFAGAAQDTGGTLEFARRRVPSQFEPDNTSPLSRVKYEVEGSKLLRSQEPVELPPMTLEGEPENKDPRGEREIVADDVAKFELAFAFWYDGEWYEVKKWDSGKKQYRNSMASLAPETRGPKKSSWGMIPQTNELIQPGQPGWNAYVETMPNVPSDGLPCYVRVRVALAPHRKKPLKPGSVEGVRWFERLILVPGALETFVPQGAADPERAEAELKARDEIYTHIKPGALALEGK